GVIILLVRRVGPRLWLAAVTPDHECISKQRAATIKSHLVTGCYKRGPASDHTDCSASLNEEARHAAGLPSAVLARR
ncbi:MAG: hypothetical protein VXY93_16635, partial [Pseudomonadota bacterium]|nr:hypothetical protein [Pseudomonadota bacterium]